MNKIQLPKAIQNFQLPKTLIGPILISAVVIAAHISFGVLDGWEKFAAALIGAMITELVFYRIVTGEWRNLSSAYISGNSAGILVRSPLIWPFALTAAISIASKYVIRFRGKHLFNPTNFGIVVMLLIASDHMAVLSIQWGNNMWAMIAIWVIGFIVISKVNLFNICATYILSFLAFAAIRSWITGDLFLAEIAPLTGPMYQLFVLFMITDPKTTLNSKMGQNVVAFLIALVEMFFRLGEAVYAPFYALFLVGPIAIVVTTLWKERAERKEKEALYGNPVSVK